MQTKDAPICKFWTDNFFIDKEKKTFVWTITELNFYSVKYHPSMLSGLVAEVFYVVDLNCQKEALRLEPGVGQLVKPMQN